MTISPSIIPIAAPLFDLWRAIPWHESEGTEEEFLAAYQVFEDQVDLVVQTFKRANSCGFYDDVEGTVVIDKAVRELAEVTRGTVIGDYDEEHPGTELYVALAFMEFVCTHPDVKNAGG